jgi:hypothetical protein
LFIGVHLR